MNVYTKTFVVQQFECDTENRFSLGAILRRVQQIGTDQCAELGMDRAYYERTQTAFLLAKTAAELYQPIPVGTLVTMRTYPTLPQRAVYFRYITLEDAQGNLLAEVDTRWVLVDVNTHRILRQAPTELPDEFSLTPYRTLDFGIKKPNDPQEVAQERAVYTRCDSNYHLNNTAYADVVCDALPKDCLLQGRPTHFVIQYHREIKMGELFTLFRECTGENSFYFSAKNGETRHFEAEITVK